MPSPSKGWFTDAPPMSKSAGPFRSSVPSSSGGMVPVCQIRLSAVWTHTLLHSARCKAMPGNFWDHLWASPAGGAGWPAAQGHAHARVMALHKACGPPTLHHAVVDPQVVLAVLGGVAAQHRLPVLLGEHVFALRRIRCRLWQALGAQHAAPQRRGHRQRRAQLRGRLSRG